MANSFDHRRPRSCGALNPGQDGTRRKIVARLARNAKQRQVVLYGARLAACGEDSVRPLTTLRAHGLLDVTQTRWEERAMASYRRIKVRPIAGALGAEIGGVDLGALDDETFKE